MSEDDLNAEPDLDKLKPLVEELFPQLSVDFGELKHTTGTWHRALIMMPAAIKVLEPGDVVMLMCVIAYGEVNFEVVSPDGETTTLGKPLAGLTNRDLLHLVKLMWLPVNSAAA